MFGNSFFYEGLDQVHHPDRPRVLIIRDWRSVGRNMQIRWTPWFWWVESQYPVCKRNVGTGYRAQLCGSPTSAEAFLPLYVPTVCLWSLCTWVPTGLRTLARRGYPTLITVCTRLSHAPLLFCAHGTSWGWSNFCLPSQPWKLRFVNELYRQFSFVLIPVDLKFSDEKARTYYFCLLCLFVCLFQPT